MRAAAEAVAVQGTGRLTLAVPVGSREAVEGLRELADDVLCLATPEPFVGVGRWYRAFAQTEDDEVRELRDEAWRRASAGEAPTQ